MKVFGTPSCRGRAGTLKLQSAKNSKSDAEQTGLRTTSHLKRSVRVWTCRQFSVCGCIVVVEFMCTTPMLSYTLYTANYEPCGLQAYFLDVDKITLLPCESIGNKVGVA